MCNVTVNVERITPDFEQGHRALDQFNPRLRSKLVAVKVIRQCFGKSLSLMDCKQLVELVMEALPEPLDNLRDQLRDNTYKINTLNDQNRELLEANRRLRKALYDPEARHLVGT